MHKKHYRKDDDDNDDVDSNGNNDENGNLGEKPGWTNKLTWDRLTGEHDQMYYICTYRDSIRIWDPRTDRAGKVYMPSWAKEKGMVVWNFKEQKSNSHGDRETNVC